MPHGVDAGVPEYGSSHATTMTEDPVVHSLKLMGSFYGLMIASGKSDVSPYLPAVSTRNPSKALWSQNCSPLLSIDGPQVSGFSQVRSGCSLE